MNAVSPIKPSRKISLSISETHSHGALGYLEMGNPAGETVVFVHGFGADLLTWQFCLVPLVAKYRLLALDLPGHGRSTPDVGAADLAFMIHWLDEAFGVLGVKQAHVIGHSMGAKIALGFAVSHASRVKSLSLISPAGLGGAFHHETLDAFLNQGDAEALARHLLGPKGQSLGASLTASLSNAVADPGRNDALKALLGNAKIYGLALSPEGFDWSRVVCPVQILWGDHDRLIPMPEAHRLPPSAPVHLIEGAGHLPHMEAPAAVIAHLKDFLP
ncbi:alpha/beta fold hydrolase [Asticcacaulis sp.]|uniref:alpha/beta fold hydrolase n=1 Tax=Asticcacaulis sp. TaxID=1872648 RepID=UPI003F7BA9BD